MFSTSAKGGRHAAVQDQTTEEERKELTKNYTKGKHSAHAVLSARALVLLDAGDGGPAKSNKEVSEATGLPVRNTVSTAPVLEEFMRYAEANALDRRYIGEYMAIERYMHRDWERFTMEGL